jgi:hypothetical protein
MTQRLLINLCLSVFVVKEKSAAVFAVRRANYTHRRKGVFNGYSIKLNPDYSNETRVKPQLSGGNFSQSSTQIIGAIAYRRSPIESVQSRHTTSRAAETVRVLPD